MKYTVQPGDTLSSIARDVLGDIRLWPEIASLNSIPNPDLIFAGQVLELPDQAPAHVNEVKAGRAIIKYGLIALAIYGGYRLYKYKTAKR